MNDIDTRYLFRMTDCTGIFQHSVFGVPDPSEGYTTDDNARALILAAMLYERSPEERYRALLFRFLSFLLYAEHGRWFRNFMNYDRSFTEKRGSEDCYGRCVLALCFTASRAALPSAVRACAEELLLRVLPGCSALTFPKPKAYALSGLSLFQRTETQPFRKSLRDSLVGTYFQNRSESWHWFEDDVTYCGGILPFAMLSGGAERERKIGLESLDFLLREEFRGGVFYPVGCRGWLHRGGKPSIYDEQPVEACSMLLACLKARDETGNPAYAARARESFLWYLGRNLGEFVMIDPETGGCLDGITPDGPNRNEGAESILCWLISALLAEKEGWFPEKRPQALGILAERDGR